MKRVAYLGIFIISGMLLAVGVLFACAAIAVPARWPLAIVLLVIGGIGAGGSAYAFRKWSDRQPTVLAARITDLAAANQGEVTLAQIMSACDVTASAAQAGLDVLVQHGECQRELRGEQEIYVLPGFKEHKVERKCPFCGATFPVKQSLQKCPNCGGNLELIKS